MKTRDEIPRVVALALSLVIVMCAAAVSGDQAYDESTPTEELKAAAAVGDSEAMVVYGMRLLQGEGDEANVTEGLDWIHKASDAGETQAWYVLGVVYANEIGVDQDFEKAIGYWRKGAEAGDADCQTSMGMVYQAGDRIPSGIEADMAEAARWYGMAAQQDHTEAIQHLAMMYRMGMGIEKDEEASYRLFKQGAELGNGDCIWSLGDCYLMGSVVSRDSVMAYALYSVALDRIDFPDQKKAMTAKRDELGKALTAKQLAETEPIIEEWRTNIGE